MGRTAHEDLATIINSGSTNSPGFRITVHPSGLAEYNRAASGASIAAPRDGAPGDVILAGSLVARFFDHLRAALPFSQYEDKGCIKSASFGFSLRIEFKDEQSPDLACPLTDPRLKALSEDVREIEQAIRAEESAAKRGRSL